LLPPRWLCFRRCFVCLSLCLLATLRKNFPTDLHDIFREGWQWAAEQMVKFRWRSGSPSGYGDCFPDASLMGDTESGINQLHIATLQCTACTSRHRHSNCDVITAPAHDRQPRQREVCTVPLLLVHLVSDHFSSPVSAFVPVCVSVCSCNDFRTK